VERPLTPYSGKATNMTLENGSAACFCETAADRVRQTQWTWCFAKPGKALRLSGLGPLKGLAHRG